MWCVYCQTEYDAGVACPRDNTELLPAREIGGLRVQYIVAITDTHRVYRAYTASHAAFIVKLSRAPLTDATHAARDRLAGVAPVIEIVEKGLLGDHPYVVMPNPRGYALTDDTRSPTTFDHAYATLVAIIDALRPIHARGLAYGRLEPAKIYCSWLPHAASTFLRTYAPGDITLLDVGNGRAVVPYAEPDQRPVADVARDMYGLGAVAFALLAGDTADPYTPLRRLRPGLPDGMYRFVDRCRARDPDARPRDLDEAYALLRTAYRGVRRLGEPEQLATDEREAELVAAVRSDPMDEELWRVYADWLEEHGFASRARYLRGDAADPDPADAAWRAMFAKRLVLRCPDKYTGCARWERLQRTSSDAIRWCWRCDAAVHYCATLDEVEACGRAKRACVIDDAVDADAAHERYG